MKTNVATPKPRVRTHEGAPAERGTPIQAFRRVISTCLLFENTFYEQGSDIADQLAQTAARLSRDQLIEEIKRAKDLGLRHAPLYAALQLVKLHPGSKKVSECITDVIRRCDEMAEILAIYWRDGKKPIPKQLHLGIENAFPKFDEYQYGKYRSRRSAITLQDVIRLIRPSAENSFTNELYRQIAKDELPTPDTWETALSSGADKKETWTRLLKENRLGAMALIRNLSGMERAGVDRELVFQRMGEVRTRGILPFQFVTAWRACPSFSRGVDDMMVRALADKEKLSGMTTLLIDVSGSMDWELSGKGKSKRLDAAGAVAIEVAERCTDYRVFTFSRQLVEVAAARGIALVDAVSGSQGHAGTHLGGALSKLEENGILKGSRLIAITDGQAHDEIPGGLSFKRGYLVNVAPYRYGVAPGNNNWTRIHGFSSGLVDWITQEEADPLFVTDT